MPSNESASAPQYLEGIFPQPAGELRAVKLSFIIARKSGKSPTRAYGIIGHMDRTVESARVGKRGAIIVPAKLRRRFGIEEGSLVIAEEKEDGILIRPAAIVPVERYSPERKAEFLLSTATTEADYRNARRAVRKLGVDPDSIPHRPPA